VGYTKTLAHGRILRANRPTHSNRKTKNLRRLYLGLMDRSATVAMAQTDLIWRVLPKGGCDVSIRVPTTPFMARETDSVEAHASAWECGRRRSCRASSP
jgi:hypothetical protein